MTYSDFKKIGRLGCGQCYETFKAYLVPLFKRIHGSDIHMGKIPGKKKTTRAPRKVDVDELKRRLKRAVTLEEFEEAARLRDEIKKYER
jgi:protein arginine kinase activator